LTLGISLWAGTCGAEPTVTDELAGTGNVWTFP
jgi:hypothetical protein